MNELAQRIGYPMLIQIIIECWNELLLLLLIVIMKIGRHRDKSDELVSKVKIPFTNELLIFFSATFLYNLCDIADIAFGCKPTSASRCIISIDVFGYYLIGGFQTLFFLQVIKDHIANELSMPRLRKAITAFQAAQIQIGRASCRVRV